MAATLVPLPAVPHPEAVDRLFRAVRGYREDDVIRPGDQSLYGYFTDPAGLHRLMMCLYQRQIAVIVLRFGLVDNQPATQVSVAEDLDISTARVRQIVGKALAILRAETRNGPSTSADTTPIQTLFASDGAPKERICNILRRNGVRTIEDLVGRTEEELLDIPNFGPISLSWVMDRLDRLGLSLLGSTPSQNYPGAFVPPRDKWAHEQTKLERSGCIAMSLEPAHKTMWPGMFWPSAHCLDSSLLLALAIRMSLEWDVRVVIGKASDCRPHAWIESPEGDIIDPTYGQFDGGPPLRVLSGRESVILGHFSEVTLSLAQEEYLRNSLKPVTGYGGWAQDSGVRGLFSEWPASSNLANLC